MTGWNDEMADFEEAAAELGAHKKGNAELAEDGRRDDRWG